MIIYIISVIWFVPLGPMLLFLLQTQSIRIARLHRRRPDLISFIKAQAQQSESSREKTTRHNQNLHFFLKSFIIIIYYTVLVLRTEYCMYFVLEYSGTVVMLV